MALPSEYELDIDKWIAMFWIERVPRDRKSTVGAGSPFGLAVSEQLRARAFPDATEGVPCDLFVFGKGEAERRDVTKIGGLPYRPRRRPWPKSEDGRPMVFVGQFRFVESIDILPALPGSILLVFVRDRCPVDDPGYFALEWHAEGERDLVAAKDIPKQEWRPFPCYGVRHRTFDILDYDLDQAESALRRHVLPHLLDEHNVRELAQLEGMKVGGALPWWIDDVQIEPDLQFLCSLPAFAPAIEVEYPWINDPKPISLVSALSTFENCLGLTVDASFYFFLDPDGNVVPYIRW